MAELKTKATRASVSAFLNAIEDRQKRADCKAISKMMREASGKNAKIWGSSIVGFDAYDYKYASGRSGTFMITGFSPRAQNIAIYIMPGFSKFAALMNRLGKYKTGKSCLYIKKLADVDQKVLKRLVTESIREMRRIYGKKK
jgi:ferritin-like metal-binding protein YciE